MHLPQLSDIRVIILAAFREIMGRTPMAALLESAGRKLERFDDVLTDRNQWWVKAC
jgi:hypothetical protein